MKTVFGSVLIGVVCFLILSQVCSADATGKGDEATVAAEVRKMFKITTEATRWRSAAVEKVMEAGAGLYDVKVTIAGPDGRSSQKIRVIKKGSAVTKISAPSTNQACPKLQGLIKKDFKLKTEQDAKTVEAALDELHPISDAFGAKDKKAKKIIQEGDGFIFVRGEFFKNLKGFIFKTDKDGSILNVSYSLKIKP